MSSVDCYNSLRSIYPHAVIAGCSTSGEILGEEVFDDSAVASAIEFIHTSVKLVSTTIAEYSESYEKGDFLSSSLEQDGLVNVLILSDGQHVNGTKLIEGVRKNFSDEVIVTGGLAGDGPNFNETLVAANDAPAEGVIAAIGFYGNSLKVGYGSAGGWDSFGPDRRITRSEGNVLYELDGKPALDLYKHYLGEEANNLPSSALLFPLMIRDEHSDDPGKVRTILSIDEENKSMIFAGDMPEGHLAKLMMANFDRLIDGADDAAQFALKDIAQEGDNEKLAILISCVGRKLVLGSKTEEEVEATRTIFDSKTTQIGFYSYGEISPQVETGSCELHNQTMTITLIAE